MKRNVLILICLVMAAFGMTAEAQLIPSSIEVTGSATINIVPDRITVEIGMECMHRIVHRYSVKVKYLCTLKNQ